MTEELRLWRRSDGSGHEAARLVFHDPFWHLSGTAVFGHGSQPCRLEYLVACSASWETLHAKITGWVGTRSVRLDLLATAPRRWRLNGRECPAVSGCIDLDLAFSPATNLLPIRRLALSVGGRAEVTAAWLQFPELALAPLAQVYERVSASRYRYEVPATGFGAELEVSPSGMVSRYGALWETEPGAG